MAINGFCIVLYCLITLYIRGNDCVLFSSSLAPCCNTWLMFNIQHLCHVNSILVTSIRCRGIWSVFAKSHVIVFYWYFIRSIAMTMLWINHWHLIWKVLLLHFLELRQLILHGILHLANIDATCKVLMLYRVIGKSGDVMSN